MRLSNLSGQDIIVLSSIFAAYLADGATSSEIKIIAIILSSIKESLLSMDIINNIPKIESVKEEIVEDLFLE